MSKTLLCTVGLPRSGKTTWANAFAKDHNTPIVNPDSVRLAIHGQRFVGSAEGFVWATVRAMVQALFLAGHDTVLVDATNTTRKRRDEWKSEHWRTAFVLFDTSREECLRRAACDQEIIPIIERMAAQWQPLEPDELRVEALGAMGTFSDGTYAPSGDPTDDEGDIKIAIAADKKNSIVRVEFGKPVAWLGFPKEHALQLAESLRFQATKL